MNRLELKQLIKESIRQILDEIKISDKDWDRMSDLVLSGKDGSSVASAIKDKNKAIARFVTGTKLKGAKLDYNEYWKAYRNYFSEFGNKALELGATPEEIQNAFDDAEVPDKFSSKLDSLKDKNFKDRFVGSFSKSIMNAGYDITFIKTNGYALTSAGKDAMNRNGRKWTIGYKTEIDANGKKFNLNFDAITDEGDGPTSYFIDQSSSKEFASMWGKMGISKFTSTILDKLNSTK